MVEFVLFLVKSAAVHFSSKTVFVLASSGILSFRKDCGGLRREAILLDSGLLEEA